VPKFSVEALLIVQVAVIATWTANVEVVLAACDVPAPGIKKQAAARPRTRAKPLHSVACSTP